MAENTFYTGNLEFRFEQERFLHNSEDFGFIAVWKEALPFLDDIRVYLEQHFDILIECKIVWSEKHLHDNAARLYEAPLYSNIPKDKRKSGHLSKIGSREFFAFVIWDKNPNYTYVKSVSNQIELSNRNIVKAKNIFRQWTKNNGCNSYAVHSTNNIHEFFFQAPLVFGSELLKMVLKRTKNLPKILEKDLEGADGWKNYQSMFEVLNFGSNYLILRNFETLPLNNPDRDIDFLTDNFQRMASLIGMDQSPTKPYKGSVIIGEEIVKIDIRFIGDNYFPVVWTHQMLDRKCFNGCFFVPRLDDYFFSLLYHSTVHKYEIKPEYKDILKQISEKLNLEWFDENQLAQTQIIATWLSGFFRGQNYYYDDPLDDYVGKNQTVIKQLPRIKDYVKSDAFTQKFKRFFISYLPKPLVLELQKIKRKIF